MKGAVREHYHVQISATFVEIRRMRIECNILGLATELDCVGALLFGTSVGGELFGAVGTIEVGL